MKLTTKLATGTFAVLCVALLFAPAISLAQISDTPVDSPTPLTEDSIEKIINKIIGWMQGIFFLIAVIFIIYAAFVYLTSAGNEEKIKKAKSIIIYAIVAIAVALLATAVKEFVVSFLGV